MPRSSVRPLALLSAASLLVLAVPAGADDRAWPSQPANLVVTSITTTTTSLRWSPGPGDAKLAGYAVLREGEEVDSTTATRITLRHLACGKNHEIAVLAFDAAGRESRPTSPLTVAMPACAGDPVPGSGSGRPSVPSVTSFALVDADSDTPIPAYAPLTEGTLLDLADLPTRHLNISAVTAPSRVGSVAFDYDGQRVRIQNAPPYALSSDIDGDYHPWTPIPGTHTVTATPYKGPDLSGTAGTPLTVTFRVIGGTGAPGAGQPGVPTPIPPADGPDGPGAGWPDGWPGAPAPPPDDDPGAPGAPTPPPPADGPEPPQPPTSTVPIGLAALLSADMRLPSEAVPHGITYPFAFHPRFGGSPGSYTALMAWGQLYECVSGNPQGAARVEIRDIEGFVKSRGTGSWRRVQQSTGTGGSAFAENFVNNVSKAPDAYPAAGGGVSARAGGGFNYHFWPTGGRATIDPGDVAAVAATVRARLAPGTFSSSGAAPCYVISAGADYWKTATAGWNQFATNKDAGIGRFKRVDANWRLYTMSTTSSGNLPSPTIGHPDELR
jgi:hypothetical protein